MKQPDLFDKGPDDTERAARMLAALGVLGMSGELTSVLAEWAGIERPLDAMRYLRGPIVVHETRWIDTIPKWLFEAARAERHEIVFGKSPYIVGPAELTAVMYPAMMEHPMHSECADLYVWAGAHATAKHRGCSVDEIWKMFGPYQKVRDEDVIVPGGRLFFDYQNLCHEIQRRVVAAQTERERAHARSERITSENEKPKPEPTVVAMQLSLFGNERTNEKAETKRGHRCAGRK